VLALPTEIPSGEYRLWVAFQFQDGPTIGEFPISNKDPHLLINSK
jgi:hypothetical protein